MVQLRYRADILSLIPLGHNVQAEIEEAFDGKTRPWASTLEPTEPVDDNDGPETVDRPEELPRRPEKKNDQPIAKPQEVTEKERKRAQEMVRLVTEVMSSDDYLSERQLEMMSIDIQFAAILLRAGLREKWKRDGLI